MDFSSLTNLAFLEEIPLDHDELPILHIAEFFR